MTNDDMKALALKHCIDIYSDYDEGEVKRFAPKSVQKAWETGRDFMDWQRKLDHKRTTNFACLLKSACYGKG